MREAGANVITPPLSACARADEQAFTLDALERCRHNRHCARSYVTDKRLIRIERAANTYRRMCLTLAHALLPKPGVSGKAERGRKSRPRW